MMVPKTLVPNCFLVMLRCLVSSVTFLGYLMTFLGQSLRLTYQYKQVPLFMSSGDLNYWLNPKEFFIKVVQHLLPCVAPIRVFFLSEGTKKARFRTFQSPPGIGLTRAFPTRLRVMWVLVTYRLPLRAAGIVLLFSVAGVQYIDKTIVKLL